jgi:hypothetical protein
MFRASARNWNDGYAWEKQILALLLAESTLHVKLSEPCSKISTGIDSSPAP